MRGQRSTDGPMDPTPAREVSLDYLRATLTLPANVASCLALLALFRGTVFRRHACMDSLARCAYAMYLVHYVFVTWSQWWLLPLAVPAALKLIAVFATTAGLSWLTARLLVRLPLVRNVV